VPSRRPNSKIKLLNFPAPSAETTHGDTDINGKVENVDAPADMPLLWALRDVVGLTGTKFACGMRSAAPAPSIWTARPSARA